MRITINHSSVTPNVIRPLIRKAFDSADANRRDVEVHVKRSQSPIAEVGFRGVSYYDLPSLARVHPTTRYLVTLRLPDPSVDGFPYVWRYHAAKTAVHPVIQNWEEALVYLAGHEARHIRQFIANLPRSEVDAEAGGMRALLDYRERTHA